jgi:kynurenine formamidase
MTSPFPTYKSLPIDPRFPPGSSWGVWGPNDELGMLNNLSPEAVKRAAQLVRTGQSFGLQAPMDRFAPGIAHRTGLKHTMLHVGWRENGPDQPDNPFNSGTKYEDRDDWVDRFHMQGSSQWDGYGHFRHPRYGDYNGVACDQIHPGLDGKLGIHRWCERGIVGRAVLLDLKRWFENRGLDYDPAGETNFTIEQLQRVADAQRVTFETGDILILRTGWGRAFQAAAAGDRIKSGVFCCGVEPTEAMAEFFWDNRFAAVASDNCSIESFPNPGGGALALHDLLLPLLGMPLGEFWELEALANACAADGRYEFMLTSLPVNVPGANGTPCQALAIR